MELPLYVQTYVMCLKIHHQESHDDKKNNKFLGGDKIARGLINLSIRLKVLVHMYCTFRAVRNAVDLYLKVPVVFVILSLKNQ